MEWFFAAVVGYTLMLLVVGLALSVFGVPNIFLADRKDHKKR